jgi:tetratricopeptide (TPR) repeat protein
VDKRLIAVSLLLALAGLSIYGTALGHPFHYDDHHSVEHNPHVRSLSNVPDFFADTHTFSGEQRGAMFRPLLLISYAVNYSLHGYQVRGYRLFGLLLHVVCSVLVYLLGRRLAGDSMGIAAAAAFLCHPLHAEAVEYVSARSDLLASAFFTGAFLLSWGAARLSVGAGAAYAGGLLAKEIAVVLPAVVAAADLARGGWHEVRRGWAKYGLLGLVTAGYLLLIVGNRFLPGSLDKAPRSFAAQGWTQVKAYVYYLWTFGMPVRLSVEPQFFVSSAGDPVSLTAAALLLSVTALALRCRQWSLSLGWAWFVLALLPASVMPLNILVSERRAYLASIGLVLVLAWSWERLATRWHRGGILAGVSFLAIVAVLCLERQPAWASEVALWEDAVSKGPLMFRPRANLGLAYNRQGRQDEALVELRQALRIKPDYADAWVELGNLLHERGSLDEAEAAYRQALACSPALEGAYHNLGNIALGRGLALAKQGRQDEAREQLERAVAQYREALARRPGFAEARNNLGQALEADGEAAQAFAEYRAALAIDPHLAPAWFNLAMASEKAGDRDQARTAYRRSLRLLVDDPGYGSNRQYQEFADRARQGLERLAAP